MYKFSPSSLKILKDCPRCFYLNTKVKDKDLITTEEGIRLTDAGKIARL